MANFSGTVKLADLNDFIAPSQACVVSLEGTKGQPPASDFQSDGVALQPRPIKKGWSQTLPTASKEDAVKISLQDCLACSGCVTSAETMLLEHQSTDEFMMKLKQPTVNVVVTLAGQSVASLAAAHGLTPLQTALKLSAFFRGLGAAAVFDVALGRDIALLETAAEFLQRYRNKHKLHNMQGWVCYAEKTHADYVLSHISSAKSPQAVMGSLVKRFWGRHRELRPEGIYHCAIMPCYDKKLEAARKDFDVPGTDEPETNSVLTTIEVQKLLDDHHCDLSALPERPLDTISGGSAHSLASFPGGSGGYMEYTFRVAAEQLFGITLPEGPLPMRPLRNNDMQEITLEVDGRPALRFALAYGFRNIQTMLRKLKQGSSPYDYVEVMACPSGCINGGGQGRPKHKDAAQTIAEVEAAYHHPQIEKRRPELSPEVQQVYSHWLQGAACSGAAQDVLHTAYHKREKTVTASVKDW